jgi:hypothetical protein
MNKEFVKKLIQSEILRYQAIKEVLPQGLKDRVDGLEKGAGDLLKEIALEIVAENLSGQGNCNKSSQKTSEQPEGQKSVKRVQVDFN